MKFSRFIKSAYFTTLVLLVFSYESNAACEYSIRLVDSYGDSWNGGSLTVFLNGTSVLSNETVLGTDNGGDWKIINFTVNTGDEITVDYTSGSWSYENEYYIYDAPNASGTLLHSSGSGGSTPQDLGAGILYANCPTCPDPSSLSTAGIAATQANLTWTENGSATTWDIELGAAGFSPTGVPSVDNTSSNPYTYTGLSQNTSYDYYVRSDCGGGDESNWVGPFTFTTTVTCPDPSALSASNITSSSADLSWTENGLATIWDIELGPLGFVPTGTPTTIGITSNPYSHAGLVPGTDYEFYVRSDCGGGDQSNWVGPFSFTTSILTGQVYVSATAGTANAIYPNMKGAFDKINDGTHMGDIVITVGDAAGQTILETAEAALNKNGVGAASYNSVTVYPGASDIKISGNLIGSCCLVTGTISLKEANNVIFDGRVGGTGSTIDLTIENTAVSSWASAFSLINASNNIIRYCKFKSSNSSTSGGTGTLVFKDNNSSGGDPGCDNNLVEYCHFTMAGSDMPNVGIASDGVSGSEEHDNNTLRHNDIYNFKKYGIWLGYSGSDGANRNWLIDNNYIYQPSSVSFNNSMVGICIGTPFSSSGYENGGFTISNNVIGGNGSGGKWTSSSTIGSRWLAGIAVNTGPSTGLITNIDGNIISDFDITANESNYNATYGSFAGILVTNGFVNVGSNAGNTIGSESDPSSIEARNSSSGGNVYGLHVNIPYDHGVEISHNTVSGISINDGSGKFGTLYGIRNDNNSNGDFISSIISYNVVSYLRGSKCNYVTGIYAEGDIFKNSVTDLDFTGTYELKGIYSFGGRKIENNEIILGVNNAGSDISESTDIIGIRRTIYPADIIHNSVLITGSTSGSENTYAVKLDNFGTSTGGPTTFENNLIYNNRSGGSGSHFGIYTTETNLSDIIFSNNAYVNTLESNNYTGYWSGNRSTLTDWTTASGETNAISESSANKPVNTLFPLYADDSLDVQDTWLVQGTYNLTTDIRDWVRGNPPTIGAYEINTALPVELLYFDGENQGRTNLLYWATDSELNNDYFILEKSINAEAWTTLEYVDGHGTTDLTNYYTAIDPNPYEITYYRLIQVDFDGKQDVSQIVTLHLSEEGHISDLYPNPTSGAASFTLGNNVDFDDLRINLFNVLGQKIPCNMEFLNKRVQLNLSGFSPGSYQIVIELNDTRIVKKIIVQ